MLLLLHMIFILLAISNILPTIIPVGTVSVLNDDHEATSMGTCKTSRCRAGGPEIKFPFSRQGQPRQCGYPGFQVSCSANGDTFMNLSSYPQPLNIIDTSYQGYDVLTISHPCPLEIFFYPHFFSTPFFNLSLIYYHSSPPDMNSLFKGPFTMSFTKIECSSRVRGDNFGMLKMINCLSGGSKEYIYIAMSDSVDLITLPSTCRKGPQTVSIPIIFIHFPTADKLLSYLSFRQKLLFTWFLPGCEGCSLNGGSCQFADTTSNRTICRPDHLSPSPEHYLHHIDANYDFGSTKFVVIGVIIGVVIIALSSTIAYFKIQKYKKSNAVKLAKQKKVDKFLEDYKCLKPTRYSYADIILMTSHWKTKLGEGRYGSVYKGVLPNQTLVAVKILKNLIDNREDFTNEVGTIGRIHHLNVVRLLGFCVDGVHHALIFQFMPNGSLDNFIFSREGREKIGSWESLQDIAISIAQGIEYLHQGCEQRILHLDIKPSNILLDHDLHPIISDFGLAKFCSKDASLVSMSAVRGTIGYIAPEILTRNSRNVSTKSDVYSYGMLLLEMVTGRKNIFRGNVNVNNVGQASYYPEFLYTCLKNRQPIELGGVVMAGDGDIAKKLITVAMWCIQWFPVNRPSMKMVIRMMYGSSESLEVPPNPFVVNDDDTTMQNGDITLHPLWSSNLYLH